MRLRTPAVPLALCVLACAGGPDVPADPPPTVSTQVMAEPAAAPPAEAPAGPIERLDAVVPTRLGGNVAALVDGDPATGWALGDTPREEGVLLRFADAVALDALEVLPCEGSTGNVRLYVNGSAGETSPLPARFRVPTQVRSAFIRVEDDAAGCLAEVRGWRGKEEVHFSMPRMVRGKVVASSTLEPAAAYHPAWLFDGRVDFAWVEGADGEGEGTTLTLTLEQPITLHGLELANGYQRSQDHFEKNGRVAVLGVQVDDNPPQHIAVADVLGAQRLDLDPPLHGSRITLTIEEAVRGSRYRDLVISELRLVDEAGAVGVETLDALALQDLNQRALQGTPLDGALDTRLTGVCEQPAMRSMKLRANHSFVVYSESSVDTDSATQEVFDGSWVPVEQGHAVKLYGRRHTVRETFSPYGSNDREDTTRIAGGKVTVTSASALGADAVRELIRRWQSADAAAVACLDADSAPVEDWIRRGAVIVEGPALTDVFLR